MIIGAIAEGEKEPFGNVASCESKWMRHTELMEAVNGRDADCGI
jgi:hypothetical protein